MTTHITDRIRKRRKEERMKTANGEALVDDTADLGALATKVSEILARAYVDRHTKTIVLAQRLFWGLPGLEPCIAPRNVKHCPPFYPMPFSALEEPDFVRRFSCTPPEKS